MGKQDRPVVARSARKRKGFSRKTPAPFWQPLASASSRALSPPPCQPALLQVPQRAHCARTSSRSTHAGIGVLFVQWRAALARGGWGDAAGSGRALLVTPCIQAFWLKKGFPCCVAFLRALRATTGLSCLPIRK